MIFGADQIATVVSTLGIFLVALDDPIELFRGEGIRADTGVNLDRLAPSVSAMCRYFKAS